MFISIGEHVNLNISYMWDWKVTRLCTYTVLICKPDAMDWISLQNEMIP